MNEVVKLAKSIAQIFDTVVIAGSLELSSVKQLKDLKARRIIWYEPDSNALAKLEREIQQQDITNVEMIAKTLSTSNSKHVVFYRASVIGFSSSCAPLKITKLRPGLQFSKEKVVAASIKNELKSLGIKSELANLLILNVNGTEALLLKALPQKLFNCLLVRTAKTNLYHHKHTYEQLIKQFTLIAPVCVMSENTSLYNNLLVNREVNWKNSKELYDIESDRAELDKKLSESKSLNAKLTKELFDLSNKLKAQTQNSANNERLLTQSKINVSKCEDTINKLEKKCETFNIELTSTTNRLNRTETELNNVQIVKEALEAQNVIIEKDKQNLKRSTADLADQIIGLKNEVAIQQQELKDKESKYEAMEQTLALNTKHLTKLNIDTSDLRKQILKKNKEAKKLKALVRELHDKLKLASAFYQHVEQRYPELLQSE
ncbi:hypothetical protein PN836_016565 [Ningiella sp. W23]|uniref:hypothetical protein n=1 Tax=Ningiella sp. W23 TaxID=3023715 RepID=UPI00375813C0